MGPNDASASRTFTRIPGTGVSETAFRVGAGDIEIVVECEFGSAIGGITSKLVVTVLNASTSTVFKAFPPLSFAAVPGPRQDLFTIAAAETVGHANEVLQVLAFLSMNIGVTPDVSIVTSPYFLITD